MQRFVSATTIQIVSKMPIENGSLEATTRSLVRKGSRLWRCPSFTSALLVSEVLVILECSPSLYFSSPLNPNAQIHSCRDTGNAFGRVTEGYARL